MTATSWLVRPKPRLQARMRLFCLPYAGGSASIFHQWPEALPPEIELCPIQPPGREDRVAEPPFTHLAPFLKAMAHALRPYLDMQFALFGHSMGGIIGFEFARYLRRHYGLSPAHLFVSGCRAPQVLRFDAPIHALPTPAFVERVRHLNGTPDEVLLDLESNRLYLPILRADFTLVETYAYADEAPLDCPITAFGGRLDPLVSRAELVAWRQQTHGAFTVRMFPGDHFFLRGAHAGLAQAIAESLLPAPLLPDKVTR